VAVVNEEVARKWWPTPQMAIGQQIKMGGPYMEGPTLEIVGVTGNVSQTGLDTAPLPEIYFPFSQRADEGMVVMIRIAGDPSALLQTVRHHVGLMDRNLPIQSLQTMETRLGAKLERRRFSTLLLTLFAALAMSLAAVGIYGVLNYWVTMRQKEIAVRLALGAQRSAILRWAGSHAVWFAAVGIVLGAFSAWGASRFLNNMVFGVSVTDPGVMVAASATVIAIAALAASIPLWRATRVDAVSNLHDA
jgi:predicted lysophospholipase L1 biosynthesis ABC-type transport system permease subunit